MKTIIFAFFMLSLTGCQTFKDSWDHQYNDDREDDLSGEWFREPGEQITDTTQYRIYVTATIAGESTIYAKKDVVLREEGGFIWLLPQNKTFVIEFYCDWKNSSPIHKVYFATKHWSHTINFGLHTKGSASGRDSIKTYLNNVFEFGLLNY